MEEVYCNECDKNKCDKKVEGALCFYGKKTSQLVTAFKSRDAIFISEKFVNIIESEMERYKKATENEGIGDLDEIFGLDKDGLVYLKKSKKNRLDRNITQLAKNIIEEARILNEIINPVNKGPMFQTNNQYNIKGGNVINGIASLPKEDKDKLMKYIDAQLEI